MSFAENKFVSCGESVKIWDFSSFTLLHEFLPPVESSGFNSVSWSLDGCNLASLPSSSSNIIFSEFKRQSVVNSKVNIGVKVSCASYDNVNLRYLAIGTSGGEVLYWDTQQCRIEKTFCSKDSEITSLVFGSNNHLAFGTLNGQIYLYNVKSHVATGPLIGESTDHIRSLDFKKGKLVSVSDDGGINLWDVNANKLLYGLENCHQAPAMAVKFILPNISTAVSVGMDKKIFVVDFRAKKQARVYTCNQPLWAVDILHDGTNIIVGGSKGDIQRYNITSTAPCESFHAQNGPVKYLAISKSENVAVTKPNTLIVEKNKTKAMNEPRKSSMDNESERHDKTWQTKSSECSTSINSSSSQTYCDFPIVINSKETVIPQSPYSETDTSPVPMDVEKEQIATNPVDDLLNYLVTKGAFQEERGDNLAKQPTVNVECKDSNSLLKDDLQIVISHVTASIKEAKSEMHSNQMYLFTQIMKHFVDLKEEIRELRQQCEGHQNLEDELYRLREENKRLKAAF